MVTTPLSKVIVLCKGGETAEETKKIIETGQSVCNLLQSSYGVNDASVSIILSCADVRQPKAPKSAIVIFGVLSAGCPKSIIESVEAESASPCVVLRACDSPDVSASSLARVYGLVDTGVRMKIEQSLEKKRQAVYVDNAQMKTHSFQYKSQIENVFDNCGQITGDGIGPIADGIVRLSGKVRDRYDLGDKMALVTTDRQSGFDRNLALVPYKGQVLNLTSAFWFRKTEHIIPNHLLSVPHPNVSIVKKCTPFPIEFVMRAYVTGSTSTSIWKNYQDGVRYYCGHHLPEGMVKNQKLWECLLTPTTKEEEHDRPISSTDIVSEGWMTLADLEACAIAAKKCFALGREIAAQHGLILVDTKYEFGKDANGVITIIDEMHTPDSSRYWLASTYEERIKEGKEPENIDKEFLRLWFRERCDPYKDTVIPEAPKDLVCELSRRYVSLFEMITDDPFEFGDKGEGAIAESIQMTILSLATKEF